MHTSWFVICSHLPPVLLRIESKACHGQDQHEGWNSEWWASLCATCAWAHIVSGFRESGLVVICTEVHPNFPVPFKVQECTNYLDRNRPNYDAMTKLAIDVEPSSSLKPVGFRAKLEIVEEKEVEALHS